MEDVIVFIDMETITEEELQEGMLMNQKTKEFR